MTCKLRSRQERNASHTSVFSSHKQTSLRARNLPPGTTSARAFLELPLPDPLAAAEGTNSGDKLPQRGLLPACWFKWFAGFIWVIHTHAAPSGRVRVGWGHRKRWGEGRRRDGKRWACGGVMRDVWWDVSQVQTLHRVAVNTGNEFEDFGRTKERKNI